MNQFDNWPAGFLCGYAFAVCNEKPFTAVIFFLLGFALMYFAEKVSK